jgi:hypothetical protein
LIVEVGVADAVAPPVREARMAAMSGVTCVKDAGAEGCPLAVRESDRPIEGLRYLVSGSADLPAKDDCRLLSAASVSGARLKLSGIPPVGGSSLRARSVSKRDRSSSAGLLLSANMGRRGSYSSSLRSPAGALEPFLPLTKA